METRIFYTNLWESYDYRPQCHYGRKDSEGNKIVQTWDNQRIGRNSQACHAPVGPIRDILLFFFLQAVSTIT